MPNPTNGEIIEDQDVNQLPADSSTAGDTGAKEPSMLEAMQAALKTDEESPASTEQDPDTQETVADDADPAKTETNDEPSEEELKDFGPRAQKRIKQLVEKSKTVEAERDTFKTKAGGFDQIVSYMGHHRLNNSDVDNGFRLMALVRNDPAKALEELMPIVQRLQGMTGHQLPEDLQEDVRLGFVTKPRAEELAKARAQARLTQERSAEDAETARVRDEQQRFQTAVTTATQTADTWYADQASKDPDFRLKQNRIGELVELELRRTGNIPSKAEIVPMLDRIKKSVEAELRQYRPRPEAVTPVNGNASPSSKPEPKTMLEAMQQAI